MMRAEQFFLGIDAGGSKTDALLVNQSGEVVGIGRSSGANYHVLGLEAALNNVLAAAHEALQGRPITKACFCMTAADMPSDFVRLRAGFEKTGLAQDFIVHNDVLGIFRAGSRFPYGVGMVCGTGFNAGGIDKAGNEVRLPALGAVTGDFVGGGYIGKYAVGLAFRAWDGRGEATMLQEAILRYFDVTTMESIADYWVEGKLNDSDLTRLTPLVFEVSEQGDPVAQQIIREQGIELGTSAITMLRRLDLLHDACDVVLGGSVAYGKGTLLMDTLHSIVKPLAPYATIRRLDTAPVVGAVLLAVDSYQTADMGFMDKLKSSLPETLKFDAEAL